MCVNPDALKGISTWMTGRGDFNNNVVSWSGVISCLSVSGFNFVAKWRHICLFNLFCIGESRLNVSHPVWLAVSSYRDLSKSNFISFIVHLRPSVSQLSCYLSWLAASKWKRVRLALQTAVELHLNTQAGHVEPLLHPFSARFAWDRRPSQIATSIESHPDCLNASRSPPAKSPPQRALLPHTRRQAQPQRPLSSLRCLLISSATSFPAMPAVAQDTSQYKGIFTIHTRE